VVAVQNGEQPQSSSDTERPFLRRATSGMYESFFGLRERPFNLAPDPRFLFLAPAHKEALDTLRYALRSRLGLTVLIGEAGTGKTTLVQAALAELGTATECVLLNNPTLTRDEFYEYLTDRLGLGDGDGASMSKTRFLITLTEHLHRRHGQGGFTALILDEAQSVPNDLLEEVRLLSNIETATTKLLNVVLAGQPELADRLNEPHLRQLKQRVALRCQLAPLGPAGTAAYVAGRLRIAGANPMSTFTREAVETIHVASAGVPRVINVICENALIGGFAAQIRPVSRAIVDEVCCDFDIRGTEKPEGRPLASGAIADAGTAAACASPLNASVPNVQPSPGRLFSLFNAKRRYTFF
jgi:general secretion pathway protein A